MRCVSSAWVTLPDVNPRDPSSNPGLRRAKIGRVPKGKKCASANHPRMGRRETPFVPLLRKGQPRTAWIRRGGLLHGIHTLRRELKEFHCSNWLPI
eukprot:1160855-Pelagomonas_calceolata.AAC.4